MNEENNSVPFKVFASIFWSSLWRSLVAGISVQIVIAVLLFMFAMGVGVESFSEGPIKTIMNVLNFVAGAIIGIYALKIALSLPHFDYTIRTADDQGYEDIEPMKIAASVFWSIYWRSIVIGLAVGAVVVLLGMLSGAGAVEAGIVLSVILFIPMGIYLMKIALSKTHFGYRIIIAENETKPEKNGKS